jgi:hypothetical protein
MSSTSQVSTARPASPQQEQTHAATRHFPPPSRPIPAIMDGGHEGVQPSSASSLTAAWNELAGMVDWDTPAWNETYSPTLPITPAAGQARDEGCYILNKRMQSVEDSTFCSKMRRQREITWSGCGLGRFAEGRWSA